MKYEVISTKVFIVESTDENAAQMTVDALENEMNISEKSFEQARYGNCSAYGKVINMAETTNIYAA